MSTPDHSLVVSARCLRRSFAFACVASLLLGSSTKADTILQFAQEFAGDTVVATESGGVTTLSTSGNIDGGNVSIPVVVSNFLGNPEPPGFVLFETFVGVTSTGTATSTGGTISQTFQGTVEFTSLPGGAGTNYLTAAFGPTSGFSGSSNSASLNASEPKDSLVFTSAFASFGSDTGMSIAFSDIRPGLSISGGSVAPFTAQNSGTFSASIVPEPGSLCLASCAVVIGTLAYGRKKIESEG
jgi:hypothetical protein